MAELEASLAPAEAEVGAMAKADQQLTDPMSLQCRNPFPYCFFIANNRFMSTFWKYLLHLSNPIPIPLSQQPRQFCLYYYAHLPLNVSNKRSLDKVR